MVESSDGRPVQNHLLMAYLGKEESRGKDVYRLTFRDPAGDGLQMYGCLRVRRGMLGVEDIFEDPAQAFKDRMEIPVRIDGRLMTKPAAGALCYRIQLDDEA